MGGELINAPPPSFTIKQDYCGGVFRPELIVGEGMADKASFLITGPVCFGGAMQLRVDHTFWLNSQSGQFVAKLKRVNDMDSSDPCSMCCYVLCGCDPDSQYELEFADNSSGVDRVQAVSSSIFITRMFFS